LVAEVIWKKNQQTHENTDRDSQSLLLFISLLTILLRHFVQSHSAREGAASWELFVSATEPLRVSARAVNTREPFLSSWLEGDEKDMQQNGSRRHPKQANFENSRSRACRLLRVFGDQGDEEAVELLAQVLQLQECWELAFAAQNAPALLASAFPLSFVSILAENFGGMSIGQDVSAMPACFGWMQSDMLFSAFLEFIAFDHSVLLDLLISEETAFLAYFIKYLRRLKTNFASFLMMSRECMDSGDDELGEEEAEKNLRIKGSGDKMRPPSKWARRLLEALFRLSLSIRKLHSKGLFPYNATALLRALSAVEI